MIPPALQAIDKYDGHYVAAPFNMHSTNWVWVNKALFDKVGGPEPTTWENFVELAKKFKDAGVVPVAHGGQAWQDATIFDDAVISAGGPEFYKKAFIELDEEALGSDTMVKAFDQFRAIRGMVDPNFPGRDWNLATAMVINGQAGMQIMGDWAKGEWLNAGKVPGTDVLCFRYPGTQGRSFQQRRVRHDEDQRGGAGRPVQARRGDHGPGLPGELQPQEGLDPGPQRRPGHQLRRLRQEGDRRRQGGHRQWRPDGQHGARPRASEAVKGAVYDVVTEFFNSDMSSADAAKKLAAGSRQREVEQTRAPA